MKLTRRNFLQGALVGMAGLTGLTAVGCAPSSKSQSGESSSQADVSATDASAQSTYSNQVSETMDCDIVVVGAGMSGLAAAVQALELGANVVVLESESTAGGNGNVTSCVMGVQTDMQKELGIEITPQEIIETEMETFNYAADGSRWSTLIHNSADNIAWLKDQGCTFATVDNYHGAGLVNTAHEWTEDGGRTGTQGYVDPMVARVGDLGGTLLLSTPGKEIILDDGKVAGIYAESEDGVIQINAKAVIIATGGFADNMDMVASKGYNVDEVSSSGLPGHNGDGISMAIAAGGKSWMNEASLMEYPMNPKMPRESGGFSRLFNSVYINGNGKRFFNEGAPAKVAARAALAVRTQDISYALFDSAISKELKEDAIENLAKAVDEGCVYQADTLEELAQAAGIDPETLVETIEKYNEDCKAGVDTEFGKDPSMLVALETPPYYLSQNNGISYLVTIGGIDTTPTCEVKAENGGIIEGLYAVGVDGVENYRGCYTIDIPGSCNANNINSGRTAAQKAYELLA